MKSNFTFDDVFPPEQSLDKWTIVETWMQGEKDRCGRVDGRLSKLESEFQSLVNEFKTVQSNFQNAQGFWNRWKCKRKLNAVSERISINRDLRHALYRLRWQLT